MNRLKLLAASVLLSCAATSYAVSQTRPAVTALQGSVPASAIFIGNSFFYYNNGIHSQVHGLIRSREPASQFRPTMVTISGSGIDWHDVDSYFRPNAVGRYSFDAGNNIVFNKLDRLFDVAIMMDCSQCPIHPELAPIFEAHARKNIETIRRHRAEAALFMSWAYADKPEMTAQLAEAYTKVANDNKALVIPAGLAFARAIAERPGINLYAPDKRHPSPEGTYLAAATVYAAILGKSPVGATYTAGLPANTARFLQEVAWKTVTTYHGK